MTRAAGYIATGFFIGLMTWQTTTAQEFDYPKDRVFETWWQGSLVYDHNDQWRFAGQQQHRLKTNSRRMDRAITELEVKFDPRTKGWTLKRLDFGFGLRYIGINDNEGGQRGFEHHLRHHWEMNMNYRFKKKLNYTVRLRYQHQSQPGGTVLEGIYPAKDFRIKHSWSWKNKDWTFDPQISFESFMHFERGVYSTTILSPFTKWRWRFGGNYTIDDQQRLTIFYMKEKGTEIFMPKISYVVGIKYRYRFTKANPTK